MKLRYIRGELRYVFNDWPIILGLLAGLWEYPNELAPADGALAAWGIAGQPAFAGTGTHIFTHVEWRMTALRCALEEDTLPPGWVWAGRGELAETYAIPSAFAPFQTLVEEGLE